MIKARDFFGLVKNSIFTNKFLRNGWKLNASGKPFFSLAKNSIFTNNSFYATEGNLTPMEGLFEVRSLNKLFWVFLVRLISM